MKTNESGHLKEDKQIHPRVLLIAPSLDILGGQAVQASRLLARMRSEPDLKISFLAINPRLPGVLRILQKVKYVRTLVTTIVYCCTLLASIRKHDVIHIFSASYFSFLLAPAPAILVARLYGKPTILNYRSGEAEDHISHSPSARYLIRLVTRIIVPSGYLVDVFGRFGFQAYSIPNVVELDQFTFREREHLNPVFFSNRNFESHYNVACVLRAFALIQKSYSHAQLTVAGDGKQRTFLIQLSQELNLQNVLFVGAVAPEKMPELYNAADIYLNGSDIDNMPGSIIESFAAGLPVVTTDAGGIPYIVTHGKTGLILPRNDYHAMAECALRLLEDRILAASIIKNAYGECQKYKWDSVRGGWLDVYNEMARGARQKSKARFTSKMQ